MRPRHDTRVSVVAREVVEQPEGRGSVKRLPGRPRPPVGVQSLLAEAGLWIAASIVHQAEPTGDQMADGGTDLLIAGVEREPDMAGATLAGTRHLQLLHGRALEGLAQGRQHAGID